MVVKSAVNNYWLVFLVFFLGLVLRLDLSWMGFHWDILSNAYWGEWINNHGTRNFYTNNVWVYSWPTQPPLVNLVYAFDHLLYLWLLESFRWASSYVLPHLAPGHMLWWFDFVKWFDDARYPESYLKIGYFMTIKLLPEIADLAIALILYLIAKKESHKWALVLSAVYLFSPFSFYLSALWGQYDQLSYLLMLLAFLALGKKSSILSPLLFVLSFSLKPTSLMFAPLYLWQYYLSKPKLLNIFVGWFVAISAFILPAWFFTQKNVFEFMATDLISKVFFKAAFRLTTNAFNFWRIFVGDRPENQNWPFLFVPAYIWGLLAFFVLHFISFKFVSQKSLRTLFASMFLIGVGGWMFLTTMLDRYIFAGIVSGLFLCIYQKNLLKYWFVLTIIFWINQFHGFWYPSELNFLQDLLRYNEEIVTRILSLFNVVIFLRMAWLIFTRFS